MIDNSDRPVKFDGLIGDAVIRGPALTAGPSAGTATAVEGYRAITIQAWPEGPPGPQLAPPRTPVIPR